MFRIAGDILLKIFRDMDGERRVRCDGIPPDARVVGICVDRAFNTIELAVESDEFPEIHPGYVAESMNPSLTLISGAQH